MDDLERATAVNIRVKKREGNMVALVYDHVRAEILNGAFPPGTPLALSGIAKVCGTSPGPVREAFRRLQQDHLIVARANQRFNVAPLDVDDLEALLSLHLANVALAVRAGVPLLTDADLKHLETCVERLDKAAGDVSAWEAAYKDFTLTIIGHTGTRTAAFVGQLMDNIQRYRMSPLQHSPRVYIGRPIFGQLFSAAQARDGVLASARYVEMFSGLATAILAGLAPQHDFRMLRSYITGLKR